MGARVLFYAVWDFLNHLCREALCRVALPLGLCLQVSHSPNVTVALMRAAANARLALGRNLNKGLFGAR